MYQRYSVLGQIHKALRTLTFRDAEASLFSPPYFKRHPLVWSHALERPPSVRAKSNGSFPKK